MTEIATRNYNHGAPALPASVRTYVDNSRAESTRRAYRSDWNHFTAWAQLAGVTNLPATPEVVAAYLSSLADSGLKAATIARRLAAIRFAHKAAGAAVPTDAAVVSVTMGGIRRTIGTAQDCKAAAVTDDIRAMVATCPGTTIGKRNRALLLLGFAGGFRRSELVGLEVRDVEEVREGLRVTIRKSKTDQEGAGRVVGIPLGRKVATCPVRSLRAWLDVAGITEGPLLRSVDRHGNVLGPLHPSGADIARVIKAAALAAELDPERYAGHSLRAGLATSAAAAGASERAIMAQTGHKSERMVRRYIREGNLFKDNAAGRVGL